jgi:hypothetical protein
MIKKPKATQIRWMDSEAAPGWHDELEVKDYIEQPLSIFKTLGWLLYDTDDFVVLAMTKDKTRFGELMKIPRKMIVSIEQITVKGKSYEKEKTARKD